MPSLMALFLDAELQALRDCPDNGVWVRRIELFEAVFSKTAAQSPNTVFPKDGSHFRHAQLQTLFDVLGIKRMPARRRRHLGRINEVVENRNAVAHGREAPEDVGRRYSRDDRRTAFGANLT
jgi:hypothetical protein